ncbi:hypothetical protein K469DRAFT_171919 [Zopfia rhizophila CBS 207.26]|uniref:Uncharacterized protein n=1 Tax=Zopfia rhizophila CBS 207.26 TaxID=1314779 RepID=A0A6A6DZY4_9PEZI|nr:hypothetical protein K469DRAFT_171919 [Zopfia rhizophila CBS 207.26]
MVSTDQPPMNVVGRDPSPASPLVSWILKKEGWGLELEVRRDNLGSLMDGRCLAFIIWSFGGRWERLGVRWIGQWRMGAFPFF